MLIEKENNVDIPTKKFCNQVAVMLIVKSSFATGVYDEEGGWAVKAKIEVLFSLLLHRSDQQLLYYKLVIKL